MGLQNTKPHETYDGLKKQFLALKMLVAMKEVEIDNYSKRIKEFDFSRIIQLESELESQKEMNDILTKELESKN